MTPRVVGPAGPGSGYVLGVLGGMGPRASAEFLRTLYRHVLGGREQDAPRVVMDSDPSFPDRTESLLSGSYAPLLAQVADRLGRLCAVPSDEVVMCCVTAHALLPELAPEIAGRVVSLVEVALAETIARGERQLLVCTSGTRRVEVFQSHPLWAGAAGLVVLPDEADQHVLHELIYRLKSNAPRRAAAQTMDALLDRYGVDSFVAGCTEMHLLPAGWVGARGRARRSVDPLRTIARRLARGYPASGAAAREADTVLPPSSPSAA